VTIDYPVLDGVICSSCIEKLEKFFKTREQIRNAEESHFKISREKINDQQSTQMISNLSEIAMEAEQKMPVCDKVKQKPHQTKPKLEQVSEEEKKSERITNFRCDICLKFLCRKQSLRLHVESVHLKIKKFKCNDCEFSTNDKRTLSTHSTIHFDSRPFVCDFKDCTRRTRTFKRMEYLKDHMKLHSNLRSYKCHCGKAFNTSKNLSQHRMRSHKKMTMTETPPLNRLEVTRTNN
jgi:hypothetical protein